MKRRVPEQSKSTSPDVKTSQGGSKASFFTPPVGSVENSRENGVRVSTNRKEDLYDDNSCDDVVTVVRTKVVETEIEVKNGDDSGSMQASGSFMYAGDELAGDDDDVSLLVDVSTEMGKIGAKESREFGERENFGSSIENGKSPDEMNVSNEEEEEEEEKDFSIGEYEFCVGDFVWGKIKSYPWWPGQIYDSSHASDYALKVRHRDRLLVAYFDGTFAWCHPYQLKHFAENFEAMSKQSTSKNFLNAVQEAVDEIGRLLELKMTCSCVPKESVDGLARPLAVNSGIKQGVLVPEGGIEKLWTYLFRPAECLTELKHVAQVVSMTNLLVFTELKCWLSAFYRAKGGYKLALFHEPQPILGLEDNHQNRVLDRSHNNITAEVPVQGPVEEETDQSSLQNGLRDSENGQYHRRKQKSIAEIMEGNLDAQVKNVDEDLAKDRTGSGNTATPSGRKKKSNDEVNGGSNLSSKRKRRRVTKLLESTQVTESGMASVKRDSGRAKEETEREKKRSKSSSIENNSGGREEEINVNSTPIGRKTNKRDNGNAKEQIEKASLLRERKKSKYLSPPYTSINRKQSIKDIEAEFLKVSSEAPLAERITKAAAVNRIVSGSSPILTRGDEVVKNKDPAHVVAGHEISDNSSPETRKQDQSRVIAAMKVKVSTNKVLSGTRSLAIDLNSLKSKNSLDLVGGFITTYRSSVFCNGLNFKMYNRSQFVRKRKTLDSEYKSQNHTDRKSSERSTRQTKIKKNEEEKSSSAKSKQTTTPGMKTREGKTDGKEKSNKPKAEQAAASSKVKTREQKTDEKSKLNKPKAEQAVRAQDKKSTNKETDGKAAQDRVADNKETDGNVSPAALFATFGPGSSLPSKDDLIKIYSKFGSLNEQETDMFYTNHRACIVFLRSSDAEEALNSSRSANPFIGAFNVKFRLQSSLPSKMRKLKEISNAKPLSDEKGSKTPEKGSASKSSVHEASPFNYMRQKLETIASLLENSGRKMSKDLKSKLEGEVNDLLEKVNNVTGSSSP